MERFVDRFFVGLPYVLAGLLGLGVFFALTPAASLETSEAWLVLMSWALVGAIGVRRALAGHSWLELGSSKAGYLFLAVLAWACLSCAWAFNPLHAIGYGLSLLSFGAAAWSLKDWGAIEPKARGFLLASLLGFLGLEVLLALGQFIHLPFAHWAQAFPWRLGEEAFVPGTLWLHDYLPVIEASAWNAPVGTFGNPNYWAEFLSLVAFPVFAWALGTPRRAVRWAACGLLPFVVWAFFLTGCRAALGAVVLAPLAAALVQWGPRRLLEGGRSLSARVKTGFLLGVVGLFSLAFWQSGQHLAKKITSLLTGVDFSTQIRLQMWKVATELWLQAPLQGHGLGSFKLLVDSGIEAGLVRFPEEAAMAQFVQLHNEPLQGLVEIGLIGLALAVSALIAWSLEVRSNSALAPRVRWGLMSGVWACLLAGCFGFPLHIPMTAFVLLSLMAIGMTSSVTAPRLKPANRPAYAVAVAVVSLLIGWQTSAKSVVARAQSAELLTLADSTFEEGMYRASAAIAEWADQTARFKAPARSTLMQALLADHQPAEVIKLYEASGKEGLGIDTRFVYAEALVAVGRPHEALPHLNMIIALRGAGSELGRKAEALRSRLLKG